MYLLADDSQIFDRPATLCFPLHASKQFVSWGLASVLIWTNDFFRAGFAPGAPAEPVAPAAGKQKTQTQWGVKDLVRRRESGGFRVSWWRNFIRMEVELTRGVALPACTENKTIWREQSLRRKRGIQAKSCEPSMLSAARAEAAVSSAIVWTAHN